MPEDENKDEIDFAAAQANPHHQAPIVVLRPDPPIAPPLLPINTYALWAVNAAVSVIEQRYRGQVTLRGKFGSAKELLRDTRALEQAARERCGAVLTVIDQMTEAERIENFIGAFRRDPELASGLSAFEQLVEHHREALNEAINDAWRHKRDILMRDSAV